MTEPTRPPFEPNSSCRSKTQAEAPQRSTADARLERMRAGVERWAEQTVIRQEKIDINFARQTQRQYEASKRRLNRSADMRAVNELRAEVAALAALAGIAPWPPAKAAPVKGPRKSRARKRRRRG
jgi:hypothetical protein